ncbi:HipA domain-containing protein [Microbacterium lacus]|uniref:type II toxin-antitoxin system HipA family toxin n=1 Tax=Microbacterium lacus TaxID=415217 RepID=UPI003850765B
MTDELAVYLHNTHIATVTRSSGRPRSVVEFLWDTDGDLGDTRLTECFALLPGLSPDRRRASRFLGGYLPEGNQRQALAAKRKIAKDDLFGFLREYGGSIAGALSFRTAADNASYEVMTPAMLRRAFTEALDGHNLGARDDSRSMLQGFQPKVLVAKFDDDGWYQPHGSAHSTHILKPPRGGAKSRLYDEFYGHELARAVGLASFHSAMMKSGTTPYLAIERYDREVSDGIVRVIHQEDAAQAMALDWTTDGAKFQDRIRPHDRDNASAYSVAELLAGLDDNPVETWLEQLVFRTLVGDNDGHAKNVSIVHVPGRDRVADLYDAVPNLFQEGRIDWTMALAVDGVFDHRNISVDHLAREARSWGTGLRRSTIEATIQGTLSRFADALNSVPVPRNGSPGMVAAIEWNLERLSAGKEIGVRR